MSSNTTSRAFDLLRRLPRISLFNLKGNPGAHIPSKRGRGRHGGKTHGCGSKGSKARQNYMRVGYETGNTPFFIRFRVQTWNDDHNIRLHYAPLGMDKLQMMIDTERIRTDIPIDVTQLNNSGLFRIKPMEKMGGFILQDTGLDVFQAKINLEVQWATEPIIAAIERNGGTISTAYYDPFSLLAAVDPEEHFRKGVPIPRRMLPPQRLMEYYSNPCTRGYLADPEKIAEERFVLAQKYGYKLPDLENDSQRDMLIDRKDPRQVFRGLQPGWLVNLVDKCITKPCDEELKAYYKS